MVSVQFHVELLRISQKNIFSFRAEFFFFLPFIPAANAPARINVPERQLANEYQMRLKRGRPIGSNDVTPRKRRTQMRIDIPEKVHD